MFNKLKSKKGFTLIELIIVMTIIAILVLLAAPSFINHVEEAKLTRIKNDTKVAENMMMAKMANDELDFDTLTPTDKKEGLNKDSKDMNDIEALTGNTYDITNLVNSKLSGRFILNEEGEVVYYDENKSNKPNKPEIPVDTEWKATDEDFEFIADNEGYKVDGKGIGYFRYKKENNKIVEIPNIIQGHEMTSYYRMFEDTSVEKVISSNKNVTDMSYMFEDSRATELDLSSFNTENVRNMEGMFWDSEATTLDLSSFDTSNVTSMVGMFYKSQVTTLDLSNFDTSNVTDMSSMFRETNVLNLDVSKFNTSKVTNMSEMFKYSRAIRLDLSNFDTKNVINMWSMFEGSEAKTITLGDNFDTSKVTNMNSMFYASKAEILDLSSFNTKNVEHMSYMFSGSQATTLDLSSFDTSNVTDMSEMFAYSQAKTLDLSSFDTSIVDDMSWMFDSSKAKEGYARTQADADRFNNTSFKPDGLTFEVKSK